MDPEFLTRDYARELAFGLYYHRGRAYNDLGQCQRAIEDFDQAMPLGSKIGKALAFNQRGVAYANLGHRQRAIGQYTEAIRLDSTFADAHLNRAIAYGATSKDAQAQQDVDRVADLAIARGALEAAI